MLRLKFLFTHKDILWNDTHFSIVVSFIHKMFDSTVALYICAKLLISLVQITIWQTCVGKTLGMARTFAQNMISKITFHWTLPCAGLDKIVKVEVEAEGDCDDVHHQTFCVKTKSEDPTEFSGVQHISSDHVLLPFTGGLGSFSTLIAMEPLPMDLHSTWLFMFVHVPER